MRRNWTALSKPKTRTTCLIREMREDVGTGVYKMIRRKKDMETVLMALAGAEILARREATRYGLFAPCPEYDELVSRADRCRELFERLARKQKQKVRKPKKGK